MSDIWPRKCGHCQLTLGRTQYQKHRREYFSQETKTWQNANAISSQDKDRVINMTQKINSNDPDIVEVNMI